MNRILLGDANQIVRLATNAQTPQVRRRALGIDVTKLLRCACHAQPGSAPLSYK